ncbi:Fe2+-dicitrate sensor, membrane component [Caulobacter sp. AP07]|uniref:FecR family protein n=1 Tax=Caulobacter sp. AP07 TaxID=1144304 RepID=UPI00027210C4|nr:FecR family protein [Caulobacter sp. AP07]EJL38029.1 Fe2+-dicitrate sensor, membrane component [Caulobacter sp. AP07]
MRRDRANPEATLWAARRLDADAAPDGAFEAWKAADPGNAEAFEQVWTTTRDPALVEALRLSAQRRKAPRSARRGAALMGGLALAACTVAGVVAWPDLQLMLVAPQHLETAPGQQREMALADGTRVTLDGATSLEVQLGAYRRRVRLTRGEAFFDVAHDPSRPFTVDAPEGAVRVLGTAFDLERGQGRLDLSVHRGKVRLTPEGLGRPSVELTIGQRATARDGAVSKIRAFDATAEDWRSGWLETDGLSLDRLIERLNRHSARPIVVVDPALGRQRVAGRFRLDEPDTLVRNLALMHGFKVREANDRLELTR